VPNFAKIGRTVPEIWPIFDCLRWRPSAILDLFYACWDHPRRVFGGPCDCVKFSCNRCSNFDSMQILIFCTLSLKMHIHAPKIGVLGGFFLQNREQCERDPEKAHPWAETRRMTYRSSKSVHVCGLGSSRIKQKIKKLKKVYLRNHNVCFFTCSPRPPTLSQRHMDLHVWSYPRPVYIFQVSSKSVQWFQSPRGSKFGLSHYFG